MDEIEINISSEYSDIENGTVFKITGSSDKLEQWNEKEIDFLIKELKKLLTPLKKSDNTDTLNNTEIDIFNISVEFGNFPILMYNNQTLDITPFPFSDYFDYRLFGSIGANGKGVLLYQNSSIGDETTQNVEIDVELNDKQKHCGQVFLDIRVFD